MKLDLSMNQINENLFHYRLTKQGYLRRAGILGWISHMISRWRRQPQVRIRLRVNIDIDVFPDKGVNEAYFNAGDIVFAETKATP